MRSVRCQGRCSSVVTALFVVLVRFFGLFGFVGFFGLVAVEGCAFDPVASMPLGTQGAEAGTSAAVPPDDMADATNTTLDASVSEIDIGGATPDTGGDASGVDTSAPDAPIGGDAGVSFGFAPSNFDPAAFDPQQAVLAVSGGVCTLDTVALTLTGSGCHTRGTTPTPVQTIQAQGVTAALVPLEDLSVEPNGTLVVTGAQPAIFAVYGSARILGVLASNADLQAPGAGGNHPLCGTSTGATGRASLGDGGGGGGGGHGTLGGGGGDGANSAGGVSGRPSQNGLLSPLTGGCRGGQGANNRPGTYGFGGGGGGGIQISAAVRLDVHGAIHASGGGGRGGSGRGGAGGGGSGGSILLEAENLRIAPGADLLAKGGGGGGGGSTLGEEGSRGENASAWLGNDAPPGGAGGGITGGMGGDGGGANGTGSPVAATGGANGGLLDGAGGGGGGGLGRVRLNGGVCAMASAALLVPPATGNGATGCPPP